MKTHASLFTLAALCAILFSACASGPTYSVAAKSGTLAPQPGKGLALIYFQGGMAGAAATLPIFVDDQVLTPKFRRGAFYAYQAAPAPVRIGLSPTPGMHKNNTGRNAGRGALQGAVVGIARGPIGMAAGAVGGAVGGLIGGATASHRTGDFVNLDVKPGETYYLEVTTGFWHPLMKLRTKEEAEKGIGGCHWLNVATN